MQHGYWDNEWNSQTIEEYQSYLEGHLRAKPWFLSVFQKRNVSRVCDAACGFGAYGAMLAANGYRVSGFDASSAAVSITKRLFERNNLEFDQYIVCDICRIAFPDQWFDATVAHAVLDHLDTNSAKEAVIELLRITKPGGLVYISFDPLDKDDLAEPHKELPDGSFLYTSGARSGLLFHYYSDQDIHTLFADNPIIHWNLNNRGEREIILSKEELKSQRFNEEYR